MAAAVEQLLARLAADPAATRALARAEAERLFAPDRVCEQISDALDALVAHTPGEPAVRAAT
jgi:hypothetical protein